MFPKFTAANSWDFNLSPGDCVYVPSFYQLQIKGHKALDMGLRGDVVHEHPLSQTDAEAVK